MGLHRRKAYFLESDTARRFLTGISHGTGLQNFPPMSEIRSLSIPVPPIAVQKAFLDVLIEVGQLNSNQAESASKLMTLVTSFQDGAFSKEESAARFQEMVESSR
jgi:hypothetical protein